MLLYATVDESEFPIVTIKFTGNKSTDENFSRYLADMKATYRHEKRFAIVFDATNAVFPALKHQKMQANWIKDNDRMINTFCAGTAYVIPQAIMRTVLKTILGFQNQSAPFTVVKTTDEARAWSRTNLETSI